MENNIVAIHWDVVFWTIVNFAIFFWLLYRLGWKSILDMMHQRQEAISKSLTDAENAREESVRLLDEYRSKLSGANAQAEEMLSKARERAEQLEQELTEKARREADEIVRQARESIERERNEAIASLRNEVADLALLVAGKVLEREVNDPDQQRLAQEFVEKVGDLR